MPQMSLDAVDAAELAELLQFLSQWLSRDPGRLGASLEDFVGHPAYGIAQLRQDLDRFTFLLGGDDGESLFGPGTADEAGDHDQPAARAQEPRRRRLRRRSSSWRAAQGTGPPLRPPGCFASRCARQPCGLPWTPETTAAPGTRNSGQAQACPRATRGAQTRRSGAGVQAPEPGGNDELAFN